MGRVRGRRNQDCKLGSWLQHLPVLRERSSTEAGKAREEQDRRLGKLGVLFCILDPNGEVKKKCISVGYTDVP